MIPRHSIIYIAIAMGLNVLYVMLGVLGIREHDHKEIEIQPVIIELIQPKKLEPPPPPPKPEPKKPEPPKPLKPEPAKPEPPKVVEPRPEPPKPEPAKPAPPAPEAPPKPAQAPATAPAPIPEPVSKPAPPPAPPSPPQKRNGVSISAGYRCSNAFPPYPTMSIRNHEQGTVILQVLVKSDGTAGSVEVKSSSGYPRLDEAASKAVKNWRFVAAVIDGKAVDETYEVPVPFKLQSEPSKANKHECQSD